MVNVALEGQRVNTRVEVRLYANDPSLARLQVNSQWQCAWLRDGESLLLEGLNKYPDNEVLLEAIFFVYAKSGTTE